MYDLFVKVVGTVSRWLNDKIFWGTKNESLSGRSYRLKHKLRWRIARNMINCLFIWQDDHCRNIHEGEVERGLVK